MLKPKKYDIAETNIALLGSDLEKQVKKAAAETEKAWQNAGKELGIEIWRIEKFKVVPCRKEQYGQFYSGDSYILLYTYKKKPDSDALSWDIHFWLGCNTTQDEAGTAAYKTVELDDVLGGAPVQHREVEGHESKKFLSYFDNSGGVRILEGGVDSGFHHVTPETYRPRLLWIKGKENIRILEVDLTLKSLNSGDVFILDAGLQIFQFNGKQCGQKEKVRAAQLTQAINAERGGKAQITVIEDGDTETEEFWKLLGGHGEVAPANSVPSDEEWEQQGVNKLFRFSDSSGKMEFKLEAEGKIRRSHLDSNDAFILDVGNEVFVWIGRGASTGERKHALQYAQNYLRHAKLPVWLPISRILEGGENEVFESYLDGPADEKPQNHASAVQKKGKEEVTEESKQEVQEVDEPVAIITAEQQSGDAAADAEALQKAMKGFFGSNKSKMTAILAHRSRDHLFEIRKAFATKFEKKLIDVVKTKSSGNLRETYVALLSTLVEYKTEQVYRAIKGLGTDEAALIDIFTQSTNEEIAQIRTTYSENHPEDNGTKDPEKMEKDIKDDTSGNFWKCLRQLMKGVRDQTDKVDAEKAERDAEILWKGGENRLGTDDAAFVKIMTENSVAHLQLVSNFYQQKHGKPLAEAVKAETSGDYKDILVALTQNPDEYWAIRAHEAIKGLGTNNQKLIRVLTCNSKQELQHIKKKYKQLYKVTLEKDVADDTSGAYRDCLLALLDTK